MQNCSVGRLKHDHGAMAEVEATVAHFKKNLKTLKKKYKFHPKVLMNYEVFNRNRTAELYEFFWNLDVVGHPDLSGAKLVETSFLGCAPFAGKKNERPLFGMAKDSLAHGLIRFEYKTDIVEECRIAGKERKLAALDTATLPFRSSCRELSIDFE